MGVADVDGETKEWIYEEVELGSLGTLRHRLSSTAYSARSHNPYALSFRLHLTRPPSFSQNQCSVKHLACGHFGMMIAVSVAIRLRAILVQR